MIENRPTPNLMADDDALWFPAHMTGGDSFLRVTRPDGAPEEDDGIGLPNREPPKRGGGGRPPKKGGFKASNWLWITLWGVTAIGIVTVAARKEIAAEIMQGWLKGQGVVSKVKFDKLSLHDASGTILIGDAAHPDVSVERFDADYSLNLFAGHGQPLFRLNSLHAVHPLVAMVLKDGRLHFGSLDKLVQAALNAPATGAPAPHAIQLDDATLLLQTDYGLVRARGNVALADGQLADLGLRLPASQFSGPAGSGTVSDGIVTAKAIAGDQLEIHAAADVASADIRGGSMVEDAGNRSLHLQNLALALDAHLPYRKGAGGLTALNGALSGTVAARADTVQGQGTAAAGLESNLAFNGELHSTATSIQYEGGARLLARADDLQSGDIDGKGLQLSGPALGLKAGWSTANGVSLAATGALNGDAALLRQGDLMAKSAHLNVTTLSVASDTTGSHGDFTGRLTAGHAAGAGLSLDAATLAITGTARADGDGWAVDAVSDIASDNGSYNGLSALAKSRRDDPKLPKDDSVVALDRALQRFSLRAKGLKASLMAQGSSAPQVDIRLQSPAIANLKGGGTLVLTPQPGAPLLATGRKGAFSIALAGPGLPQAKLTAADIGTDARTGLLSGSYVLSSHLTAAPVTGVAIDNAHGRFTTTRASGFDVTLDAPTAVTVASAELGDHIENVKVTVAQRDGALFRLTPSGWHASALFNTLSLTAPVEGLKVSDGQGSVDVYSQAGSDVLGLKMQLAAATLSDGLPVAQRRFNAMLLTGTLGQDMRRMTGRFTAGTPDLKTKSGGPTPIATIALDNDVVTNAGSLSFATVGLNFAPDGLQPIHLSPQIASVMSRDVSGTATFTGAFDWTKTTTDSHGVLTVDGLNFRGGMGVAQGLSGKIVFTSLAPLRSDPGQRFSLDNLAAIVPLSHFFVSAQFQGDRIAVEAAEVMTPGGKVLLDPTSIPLDDTSPISGALSFNGLDFGKVIASTNLSQNMTFEGTLTGRVPFAIIGGLISFQNGAFAADRPGTISIKRSGVTDVSATGSLQAPTKAPAATQMQTEFNPFQDLAFQAMEHVAYEQLDAKINSLPDHRIDVNFHIKGRFQPPHAQKATISLSDYISGKWMQKPITLPSGTPVELYLDMPLGLPDVFKDLGNSGTLPAVPKTKP